MTERPLLFSTPHGSHLYGLAHAGSDRDTYAVYGNVPHKRAHWARQTIVGDQDQFSIDLGTWLHHCEIGVPQALEAMFSPIPTFDQLGPLRAGFRVGTAVIPRFMRTIRSFCADGSVKRRRHALRLSINARDLLHHGRYDPTMTPEDAKWATRIAESMAGDEVAGVAEAMIFR